MSLLALTQLLKEWCCCEGDRFAENRETDEILEEMKECYQFSIFSFVSEFQSMICFSISGKEKFLSNSCDNFKVLKRCVSEL